MAKRPEGRLQRRRGDIADLVMFVGKTLADRNVTVYADSARLLARIAGLFARLFEATGDHRWRTRAIETYRSLTRVDPVRRVWHWEGTHRWRAGRTNSQEPLRLPTVSK